MRHRRHHMLGRVHPAVADRPLDLGCPAALEQVLSREVNDGITAIDLGLPGAATRGVALDHVLLAALGAGVPIGLGVYLAWVHRDLPARTKSVGFLVASGGALLGAWLGFLVTTTGLVAPLAAIAGAILGSNLLLLVLDIAAGGSERPVAPAIVADRVLERVGA